MLSTRTNLSDIIQNVFIGDKHAWSIAQDLNAIRNVTTVNIEKIKLWMKYLGEQIPSNIDEIADQISAECQTILQNTILADDTETERLDIYAGSDTARTLNRRSRGQCSDTQCGGSTFLN